MKMEPVLNYFIKMKIKYSRKIDKEIFDEVNRMRKKLSPIFGFQFPKIQFDKRVILIAKAVVAVTGKFINENGMKTIMSKIYREKMPSITIYVNTTPFSTWNVKEKWISISFTRIGKKFYETACHETNHFMYDFVFKTKKYQDTEIKETLTVLNNVFGITDVGWSKFSKQRKKVLKFYNKTKDFKKTINYAQSLF